MKQKKRTLDSRLAPFTHTPLPFFPPFLRTPRTEEQKNEPVQCIPFQPIDIFN